MNPSSYAGYLKGTVIAYLWRCEKKGTPLDDLIKARTCLDLLVELYKKAEEKE